MLPTAGRTAASSSPSLWRVPALFIALSFIPIVAGAVRVGELSGDASITPDNARFLADPVPAVLHIVSSSLWSLLGAFQFSAGIRRRYPRWHRIAGRVLAPLGLLAALSGLWMTLFYTRPGHDGPLVDFFRLAASLAMALFIVLGVVAVLRRDIPEHRAWMMRAYAIALGASTQVLTHLPWFIFPEMQSELTKALCMSAGWAINVAVVERIIRRSTAVSATTPLGDRRQPLHADR